MSNQPDASSAADVAGASHGLGDEEAALKNRRLARSIAGVLAFEGFTMSINGIGAPWIAKSFQLGESGIAGLFAWISLSAIGAMGLSRMIDRVGRRRMLLVCMAGTSVSALAAALSTDIAAFAVCEIALYAFIGATIAGGIVILAEELAISERARGQSWGGLGIGLGGGMCLIVMPMVASRYSWRWMLVLASAMGVAALWRAARVIPESGRWQRAAAAGTTSDSSFYDAFGQLYRRRAITILVCSLLANIAGVAGSSWAYFHLVSVVGLAPGAASLLMLVGGGVGMLGFPIAARSCERYGRIPTIFVAALNVQSRRGRLLLGSSGALGPSLAMDRGHVLLFHRWLERGAGGRQFAGDRTFSHRDPRCNDGMVRARRRGRRGLRPDSDRGACRARWRSVDRGRILKPARDTQRDYRRALSSRNARPLARSRRDGRKVREASLVSWDSTLDIGSRH
jgi:MFS family permease